MSMMIVVRSGLRLWIWRIVRDDGMRDGEGRLLSRIVSGKYLILGLDTRVMSRKKARR
jgi:hypothetical protein